MSNSALEIEVEALNKLIAKSADIQLLDVREGWETEICALPGSIFMPLSTFTEPPSELDPEKQIVVICHHGMRSLETAFWLRENGWPNAVSLRGGIDAWARRIDPDIETY